MPVSARIVSPNLEQWKRAGFATARTLNAPQLVNAVSTVLQQRWEVLSRRLFTTQGGSGAGGRWPDLSDEPPGSGYRSQKAKSHPGKTILRREDILWSGLLGGSGQVSFGTMAATGFSYRYGVDVGKSAGFHQEGGSIPGRPPIRKVIDPTRQQMRGMGLSIARTMEDGMFTRMWFELKGRRDLRVSSRFTGFDSPVDVDVS